MNNYTTARKPLRLSENSNLLLERLLEPIPAPMPPFIEPAASAEPIPLKTLRKPRIKKNAS